MRPACARQGLRHLCPRLVTPGCRRHAGSRTFASTQPRRQDVQQERQWSTPLAKQLAAAISMTGPVPLASYMRMCLTGDLGGYYTGAIGEGRDQFGTKGDFVTSPEISQIFGELLGIWFLTEWMGQGRPKTGVQLIEVGPGRGTLMDDMLRTISRFPAMANSIESVIMVEAGKDLRKAQKDLLCGPEAALESNEMGEQSISKAIGRPVVWADSIKSIPIEADKTPFIVAHEFFDALPIHTFQTAKASPKHAPPSQIKTKREAEADAAAAQDSGKMEWREYMVNPVHPSMVKSESAPEGPAPEFHLLLSSTTTRHSRYLPTTSERYTALSQKPDAVIEVCPDASLYATDFAARIGGSPTTPKKTPSGAALILDYGTSAQVPAHSLRGIKHHRMVNPFTEPGLVDLSADVDFTAIAETALLASEGVEVHGPVAQADFLEGMGIRERAAQLLKAGGADGERTRERIERGWQRLVDRNPEGMGHIYKALAILPENGGRRRPVGFGGDITA